MTLRVSPAEIVARSSDPMLGAHESWSRIELGQVAEILNGFAFKSSHFNRDGIGLPLIRIRDVGKPNTDTYYSGEYDPRYIVPTGSTIIGMDGDFRVAQWSGPPALLNQRVCKVTIREEAPYDDRFLLHVLPGYLSAVHEATSSITVKHLSSRTLEALPLPLPPLAEQRRIMEAIEEHFSRLDAAQNSLRADVVRRLDTLEVVLLSEAFAGDWPTTKLGDISEALQYGWTSRSTATKTGYRYLRITDMTSGVVDWSKVPFCLDVPPDPTRFLLHEDDILIARSGATFGRSIRVQKPEPAVFASYLIRLRPIGTVWASFVEWFLRSTLYWRQVNAFSSGIAQPNVNARKLAQIRIPLPPTTQQHAIVESLETSWTLVSALRETLQTCRSRAAALRTAILREAFNGRLVQREPADEPTSTHLAGVGG